MYLNLLLLCSARTCPKDFYQYIVVNDDKILYSGDHLRLSKQTAAILKLNKITFISPKRPLRLIHACAVRIAQM